MISKYGTSCDIQPAELSTLVERYLSGLEKPPAKVLVIPPDHTRLNSMAGPITGMIYDYFSKEGIRVDILPALGTHNAMTDGQLRMMFGNEIPLSAFHVHDWRNDIVSRGTVPGEVLSSLSAGKVDYPVNVQLNRLLFAGYDLIISVGQVVPHEVVGMANYTKNIVVGVGGSDMINKSHFLGAVCNMETIMGRAESPARRLFNYAVDEFLGDLPIHYMLTVVEQDHASRNMLLRGFFAGESADAFNLASELSRQVNVNLLDKEPQKVIVYLDPHEFQSTWLGNKAIYRTRMAIADGGELIVLAPALHEFGEDAVIDQLIRKYGYRGTSATLKAVQEDAFLRENLSAAAHLVHGSSEGRFSITYCPGQGGLSLDEIKSVGYHAEPYDEMIRRYRPEQLKDGYNTTADGEEVYFISNPALGLWASRERFEG